MKDWDGIVLLGGGESRTYWGALGKHRAQGDMNITWSVAKGNREGDMG